MVVAEVAPFSGPDAAFGPNKIVGCDTASSLINADGGVLGQHIVCQTADTRGDAADAVPAVNQLLGTTQHLLGIVGVTSDEALAVSPIINRAHIPFFSTTGQTELDHNSYPYFYRLVPPDSFGGYAMALWGNAQHYQRAALVFGSDVGSQGTVPTLMKGLAKLGSPSVVSNQTLTLDQPSYRSEIESMLAAHPDVIFMELDTQSGVTFFKNLKELGSSLPVIGSNVLLDPTWDGPVAQAIGVSQFKSEFTFEGQTATTSGPGYDTFKTSVLKETDVPNASTYAASSTVEVIYDGINLMALAAIKANSLDPTVYNPVISQLTKASPGATKVYSFAEGKAALAAGKTIQYVGLSGGQGGITFDAWHNSPGETAIWYFPGDPTGNPIIVPGSPSLTAADLVRLES